MVKYGNCNRTNWCDSPFCIMLSFLAVSPKTRKVLYLLSINVLQI